MNGKTSNNYLPLFRKYRPQSFKDVIGQEFTVRALENAIKLNKIANAYLFCGPRGTGKTSSARIFAKSLNCANGPTVDPCQKCQSCLDVTNASGLDVIEIDAATNRGIDDARELINKVQYAPMSGKYKIFIIDEVHMLSKEAFNALLKTFEEPPENVIFILATTEPHKVIETIVSRCQRFDFKRITINDIVKRLKEISLIEKINITDDALYSIAKNVSGGMRDSLALLDQVSVLGVEKQITKETIEMLTGKLTFDTLYDLTLSVLNGEIEEGVKKVEKIYEKGSEPRNFVENYIEFLRNTVFILSSKDDKTASEITLVDKTGIEKIKNNPLFNCSKLISIMNQIVEYYKEIKTATNPYLWAEVMIIAISSLKDNKQVEQKNITKSSEIAGGEVSKTEPSIRDILNKENARANETKQELETKASSSSNVIQDIEKAKDTTLKDGARKAENDEPASYLGALDSSKTSGLSSKIADSGVIWAEILNKVESVPAKFFYSGVGKLIRVENGHITLGFVNQNAIVQAKSENKYKPLLKSIKAVLGEDADIEFVTVTKDTKIIESKINTKIITPPEPKKSFSANDDEPSGETSAFLENSSFEREHSYEEDTPPLENSSEQEGLKTYTKITAEMLEMFEGRVIED